MRQNDSFFLYLCDRSMFLEMPEVERLKVESRQGGEKGEKLLICRGKR